MLAQVNCKICGKRITPETGVRAGRWFVCNEHAHMIRTAVFSSGRMILAGADDFMRKRAPGLHTFIHAAIKVVKEENNANGSQYRSEQRGHQQTQR